MQRTMLESILLWKLPPPEEGRDDLRFILRIFGIQTAKGSMVGALAFLGGIFVLPPLSALALGLVVTLALGVLGMVVMD